MRDVRLEMNLLIRRELAGRLVNEDAAGSVARELVKRLRAQDPALLASWALTYAEESLARHIARRHPAPVRNGPGPEALAARKAAAAARRDAAAA